MPETPKPDLEIGDKPLTDLPAPGETVSLTPQQRKDLCGRLQARYLDAAKGCNATERKEQDQKWWSYYNCSKRIQPKNWPLTDGQGVPHSSNLNIASERATVDGLRSQTTQSLYMRSPIFRYQAKTPEAEDRALEAERNIAWRCDNDMHFPRAADKAVTYAYVEGESYVHIPWRKEIVPRMQPETIDQATMEPIPAQVVEDVDYEGLRLEVVSHNDLLTYPASEKCPQKAEMVFYDYPISRTEVLRRCRSKEFYTLSKDDRELLAKGDAVTSLPAEGEKDDFTGDLNDNIPTRYQARDVYFAYDVGNDGFPIEVVATYLPAKNLLLRVTPSIYQKPRPFAIVFLIPDGKGGGVSVFALTESPMAAIDMLTNQMADTATYNIMAAMTPMVPDSVGVDLTGDWLGAPLPVRGNPREIAFPPQVELPLHEATIERCWQDIEIVTGWSRNAAGSFSNPNRPPTATEVSEVASSGNLRFQMLLEVLDEQLKDVGDIIRRYLNIFLPLSGEEYSRPATEDEASAYRAMLAQQANGMGQPEMGSDMEALPEDAGMGQPQSDPSTAPVPLQPVTVTRETFADGIACVVEGSRAGYNRDIEFNKAMSTSAVLQQHPLVQQSTKRLWEATRPIVPDQRNLEQILGPKPSDDMTVPQLMSQLMPPAPPAPPNEPSISIRMDYINLPPEAQLALLQKEGLDGGVSTQELNAIHPANPMSPTHPMNVSPPQPIMNNVSGGGDVSENGMAPQGHGQKPLPEPMPM